MKTLPNKDILNKLLLQITKIDYRKMAGLSDKMERLSNKHFVVYTIEYILNLAKKNNWGLCQNHGSIYLYNGAFWNLLDNYTLQTFLGRAAKRMGVDKTEAQFYYFKDQLIRQFISEASLPEPEKSKESVLINLKNGTFNISPASQSLQPHDPRDFQTYQLPFNYDTNATAPTFLAYLNKVLPSENKQKVLAEYLGYVFISNQSLKLEKFLLLFGGGSNGKSVFAAIVHALLGSENVCAFSLQNLTNDNGYYRAMIENKLINYSSEINGRLDTAILKQMASGEPIEARTPYGKPFIITNYAKLIFNCNELPKDIEHTNAFFRRFLIIPFDVTILEGDQDKELANKIIKGELSGIFNWVLEGLRRVLLQKKFTECDAIKLKLEQFRNESDSVLMFLQDEGYKKSTTQCKSLLDLFGLYMEYCQKCNYRPCSIRSFGDRLRNNGFEIVRKSHGRLVYVSK